VRSRAFLSEGGGSTWRCVHPKVVKSGGAGLAQQENAQLALDSQGYIRDRDRSARAAWSRSRNCARALNSSRADPHECFSTSRTSQGQEIVGSGRVRGCRSRRKEIDLPQVHREGRRGPDDFASMREVISRRFSRLFRGPQVSDGLGRVVRREPKNRRERRRQGPVSAALAAHSGARSAALLPLIS